jgi:hypothetical protein
MTEQELLQRFVAQLSRYLPEASGYGRFPQAPLGTRDLGKYKRMDLLLVEGHDGVGLRWVGHQMGRARITSEMLRGISAKVWIVEAKISLSGVWQGLGQVIFYRALVKKYYLHLRVAGCVVLYPKQSGRDEAVESAVTMFKEEFGVEVKIIAVA